MPRPVAHLQSVCTQEALALTADALQANVCPALSRQPNMRCNTHGRHASRALVKMLSSRAPWHVHTLSKSSTRFCMLLAPQLQPASQHHSNIAWHQPSAVTQMRSCRALGAVKEGSMGTLGLTRESLMALKVVDLQALLVERQLAKSGKKDVLVERLLAHAATSAPHDSVNGLLMAGNLSADQQGHGSVAQRPVRTRRKRSTSADAQAGINSNGSSSQHSDSSSELATGAVAASTLGASSLADQAANGTDRHQEDSVLARVARGLTRPSKGVRNPASQEQGVHEAAQAGTGAQDMDHALPADLPPMPVLRRGRTWAVQDRPDMDNEELARVLQSNPQDLQICMLGTAADLASRNRALASIALSRGKDVWLFDAGDDTQRQLGVLPHIKPSKLYRIFITCLVPETLLGLPGMLCTISAARVKGHEKTDIPIHVYGPRGLADFLSSIFKVSNTYLETNILVVEFADSASEEQRQPTLFNRRARIFRALLPPDQLNPDGCFNGDLAAFMPTQRATQARGHKSAAGVLSQDERAVFLPFEPCPPGDPTRKDLRLRDMHWTVEVDSGARLTAVALPAAQPTFAYTFQEADRAGMLVVERAQALGVPGGRSYSMLKDGLSVTTQNGRVVTPDMVVTANKPGRRVVVLGNTGQLPGPDSAFARVAQGADAWVSGCVGPQQKEAGFEPVQHAQAPVGLAGTSTTVPCVDAGQLAALACQLQVQTLLLARFSTLADGPGSMAAETLKSEQQVLQATEQARASASQTALELGPDATAPTLVTTSDFWVQVFEKHEGPASPEEPSTAQV